MVPIKVWLDAKNATVRSDFCGVLEIDRPSSDVWPDQRRRIPRKLRFPTPAEIEGRTADLRVAREESPKGEEYVETGTEVAQ
ncbi:MAG: hypothetical protein Q9178_004337 [Gyalolechia marmorata]